MDINRTAQVNATSLNVIFEEMAEFLQVRLVWHLLALFSSVILSCMNRFALVFLKCPAPFLHFPAYRLHLQLIDFFDYQLYYSVN